jgi:hypothetical protein
VFKNIDITDIVPIIAFKAMQKAQSKVLQSIRLPKAAYLKSF